MNAQLLRFFLVVGLWTTLTQVNAQAPRFTVTLNADTIPHALVAGNRATRIDAPTTVTKFKVHVDSPAAGTNYLVRDSVDGHLYGTLNTAHPDLSVDTTTVRVPNFNKRTYFIETATDTLAGWSLISATTAATTTTEDEKLADVTADDCKLRSIEAEMRRQYEGYMRVTPYGIELTGGTKYPGRKYAHLFFDQAGNSLLSTVPQGISNRQYVVHVIYMSKKSYPGRITYSVRQTKGEFSDELVFRNSDEPNVVLQSKQCDLEWASSEWLLSTSTSNIEFNILRNITGNNKQTDDPETTTSSVATHTIKMTKVYHGSIDVGLVNSTLENPTFTLVTAPDVDTLKVVKRSGGGNRGIVTLMATFYTSPFYWFKRKGSVPDYKRTGRNFLDDHRWYERIYPCMGVGISDRAFENLFFGLNWEVARGGSLFFGAHYGRVNTYTPTTDDFEFGTTHVTPAQFDLASDTKWQLSPKLSDLSKLSMDQFCFGANIDLRLITRLFSAGGSGSPDTAAP